MIIKEERITDNNRVIIDSSLGGYLIEIQQYVGQTTVTLWEVGEDGWRICSAEFRKSLKEAEKLFTERLEDEKRNIALNGGF